MPVSAKARVEQQKRIQTASTLWPFGFVFGIQLDSLENLTRRERVHAALVHMMTSLYTITYGKLIMI